MTSSRIIDLVLTIFFGILGVIAIFMVGEFPFRDQLFPWVASIMILLFAFVAGTSIIRSFFLGPAGDHDRDDYRPSEGRPGDGIHGVQKDIKLVLRIFGFIFLLVLMVFLIGHMIAIPAFIFLYMVLNREPFWIAGVSAAGFWGFTWVVLIKLMNVAFPIPYAFDWLGL